MSKKNKKSNSSIVQIGNYSKNKNGSGGMVLENSTKQVISISDRKENFALDGDSVEVIYRKEGGDKLVGEIVRIIAHNTTNLVGTVLRHRDKLLLRVQNQKFGNYLVCIDGDNTLQFNPEELFNTVIVSYPSAKAPFFVVKIINSLGLLGEDDTFIAQAIVESDLPIDFSQESIAQAQKYRDKVLVRDLKQRVDLRDLAFVTIDGEDAKDFDDAVYCEKHGNNFILFVAIADVAHFVTHESPLDIEAYQRGTSVYFPRQVIPMLPERLSNGLCSLKPDKERLAMCCKMTIDGNSGKILKHELANVVIKSRARLTYMQVQSWIDDNKKIPPELKANIIGLYNVYKILLVERNRRGAIDFETEEPYFEFDKNGEVVGIHPRMRVDAHKLIEECMLAANVCVAEFIIKHSHPCLFRVHEKPSEAKYNALKAFLNSMAIDLDVSYQNLVPLDYLNLINSIKSHPKFRTIQQVVLRSMQLAVYSSKSIGHFGLSYEHYLHFTSPIRRYPDLLVHRIIKSILKSGKYEFFHSVEEMGEHTSFTERRAEELERKIDSFYKCKYAQKHIGSTFNGCITSVTNFGLFVYIPDLMLDGLVHITELGDDYFVFNERTQALVGKKSGVSFSCGQELEVMIAGVDAPKLFIDLALLDEPIK